MQATKFGPGTALVGFSGATIVEVLSMTGWEIPTIAARVIFFLAIGLAVFGFGLIWRAFREAKREKKTYQRRIDNLELELRLERMHTLREIRKPWLPLIPVLLWEMHRHSLRLLETQGRMAVNPELVEGAWISFIGRIGAYPWWYSRYTKWQEGKPPSKLSTIMTIALIASVRKKLRLQDRKMRDTLLYLTGCMNDTCIGVEQIQKDDELYTILTKCMNDKEPQISDPELRERVTDYQIYSRGLSSLQLLLSYSLSTSESLPERFRTTETEMSTAIEKHMLRLLTDITERVEQLLVGDEAI